MSEIAQALPGPRGTPGPPARASLVRERRGFRVLPGFGLTLGYTLFYVSLIVLLPFLAAFVRSAELGPVRFWQVVSTPRVLAALRLSFGGALLAALVNAVFGFIIAWALTRTRFPGRRIFDAMIDLRRQVTAWSAEAERHEGELLGYADWQNELWLKRRSGRP